MALDVEPGSYDLLVWAGEYDESFEIAAGEEGVSTLADFARNHIYQVVVTGVLGETEVGLKIAYGVCPWDTRTVDIPPFE